jgi:hypothetical protein
VLGVVDGAVAVVVVTARGATVGETVVTPGAVVTTPGAVDVTPGAVARGTVVVAVVDGDVVVAVGVTV